MPRAPLPPQLPSRASAGTPARQRALRAQGKRTMGKLLEAGVQVFDERGYLAARVDDVVKAADTSHGTFYLYFANKEDLFQVLAGDCVRSMNELTDRLGPVGAGPDGYQRLREWLAAFVAAYRRHGAVIRAWTEAQLDNRELARLGGKSMTELTTRIAERIAIEEPRSPVDPQQAALAVVAMVERLNYYVLSRRIEVDDDALLDTLATILHLGLFGGRTPAGG